MDGSLPTQSHGSPPPPPPRRTAVASFGEPEDDFQRSLRQVVDAADRKTTQEAAEALTGHSTRERMLQREFWNGVTGVDEAILKLLDRVGGMSPEEIGQMTRLIEDRRAILADQIALERLTQRPPKQGHLPFYADDELIAGYERTVQLLDKILAALRARGA